MPNGEQVSVSTPDVVLVVPVIDYSIRELCTKPYPLHPKGCPNVGKCDRCPPTAPLFDKVFDLGQPVYAVINQFDLAGHMAKMAIRNPHWSDRQLRCVLYWQGTARKQLRSRIISALISLPGYSATSCPEGQGVDVTATLAATGVWLEWPPVNIVRQVAFLGKAFPY